MAAKAAREPPRKVGALQRCTHHDRDRSKRVLPPELDDAIGQGAPQCRWAAGDEPQPPHCRKPTRLNMKWWSVRSAVT
jgi:hypothetical protein